jgi:hypothetical protein
MEERLKESGGKAGTSYRAVVGYLKGESEPSLHWVREAADLLDVRVPWLLEGEPPARLAGAAITVDEGDDRISALLTSLPWVHGLSADSRQRLQEELNRLASDLEDAVESYAADNLLDSEDEGEKLVRDLVPGLLRASVEGRDEYPDWMTSPGEMSPGEISEIIAHVRGILRIRFQPLRRGRYRARWHSVREPETDGDDVTRNP